MSCNLKRALIQVYGDNVSIPIGFSNELQRCGWRADRVGEPCFNPYRVFQ